MSAGCERRLGMTGVAYASKDCERVLFERRTCVLLLHQLHLLVLVRAVLLPATGASTGTSNRVTRTSASTGVPALHREPTSAAASAL